MVKRSSSGKPICVICNRPFDPASPGATMTMGPTCAKRSGVSGSSQTLPDPGVQPLWLDDSLQLSPRLLAQEDKRQLETQGKQALLRKLAAKKIPRPIFEAYVLAKIAFDELYREFSPRSVPLHGEDARAAYEALKSRETEDHSFNDPVLSWLEPEYDLHLFIDRDSDKTYYARIFGGTYTLLEVHPRASLTAKQNVALIHSFTAALQAFRKTEDAQQLSLAGLDL